MNSSIDVRNKSCDPGFIALLMFNKKNNLEKPLNFPIHLKIPKPLVKMIFDYSVGEQIKITVHFDYFNFIKKYSLTLNPTTKLSEIASLFNKNYNFQIIGFINENDKLTVGGFINEYDKVTKDEMLMPDDKSLRDCAIQDGHRLILFKFMLY